MTQNKPRRIFITGIAGFIGFHLARYLKKRGDFVMGCDNFNSYYNVKLKRARARLLQEEEIATIECDIGSRAQLEHLLKENGITHLVHLAAYAGVRHSIKEPQAYIETNLKGFVDVLECCRHLPGIKLIYASSSSVYGLNEKVPFAESDMTDRPASFYGATKKANELIAHSYHQLYAIPVTGLRYFTVYGPWGRPDMAYYSFTRAILKGDSLPLFNHGVMKRDFTYIDDIVRGTAAALDLGAPCEIFNLGSKETEELSTLVSLIEKYTEKKAHTELLPMQSGDVTMTCADIAKSQKLLGYEPTVSLEEGIERFVQWYRSEPTLHDA
jgi:UDP-glucuronate 4-epimerase